MITSSGVPDRGFLSGSLLMEALLKAATEEIVEEEVSEDDEPDA